VWGTFRENEENKGIREREKARIKVHDVLLAKERIEIVDEQERKKKEEF
jgi:hypothetical protein